MTHFTWRYFDFSWILITVIFSKYIEHFLVILMWDFWSRRKARMLPLLRLIEIKCSGGFLKVESVGCVSDSPYRSLGECFFPVRSHRGEGGRGEGVHPTHTSLGVELQGFYLLVWSDREFYPPNPHSTCRGEPKWKNRIYKYWWIIR